MPVNLITPSGPGSMDSYGYGRSFYWIFKVAIFLSEGYLIRHDRATYIEALPFKFIIITEGVIINPPQC